MGNTIQLMFTWLNLEKKCCISWKQSTDRIELVNIINTYATFFFFTKSETENILHVKIFQNRP